MKHIKLFEQFVNEFRLNEAYDGDLSDFEYDLMMAIDELGFSPKAIKKITKKGDGYEVRMSSYMNQERNWQAIADEIGAELKSFKKDASINIGVFEAKNQAYESAQDQGLLD